VALAHDERVLRRRRLVTSDGEGVLVDLPGATRALHGDGLDLGDGRLVEVVAAEERLLEARMPTAEGLARLAWHVGNRHAPAQVEADRLLVPHDHVMRAMLLSLGAEVRDVREPFHPEGGAYDHGATLPQAHPPGTHG
jgi:urease accessory protein